MSFCVPDLVVRALADQALCVRRDVEVVRGGVVVAAVRKTSDGTGVTITTGPARLRALWVITVVVTFAGAVLVSKWGAAGLAVAFFCGLLLGGWRATRLAVVLSPSGVMVRNSLRNYRLDWGEVERFSDGSIDAGSSTFKWALAIVPTGDRRTINCGATSLVAQATTDEIIDAVREVAAQHGKPCSLTGSLPRGRRAGWRRRFQKGR